MLKDISSLLQKIAYGKDLSSDEARKALNAIGAEDRITDSQNSDGYYFLALTFGIMAKGPTRDELHGFVLSISDQSIRFTSKVPPSDIIDVSGTGGDRIKTFNVGTTASIVIAAGGGYVAKQATRGYTGFTGSADIFREIGLDPFQITANDVESCFETLGIAAFYTPALTPGFKNRIDFLTKLKQVGLTYPTPWHLVSWVYSPFNMHARLYGVFDAKYVRVLAELFKKLGYRRVMVVHGMDGLDEISNVGETLIAEVHNDEIKEYRIKPEDYGLRRARANDIETLTPELLGDLRDPMASGEKREELANCGRANNINDFFRILYGKEIGPKRDIVLMNAGAGLYLCGKAQDPKEGIERARQIISSGKARDKLQELARHVGGHSKLQDVERRLGL